MKTYILLLAGFSLNFIACSKTADSKTIEVKKFLKLKKITGPTFYDENFLLVSFSDSALYFYNENQRISKIIYYSTYVNPNNVTGKVSVEENYTYDSKGRISEITNIAPSWFPAEKRVTFYYNSFNDVAEAHVILRTAIDEGDSIVYSYGYSRAPFSSPLFVNGEEIVKQISSTRKNYSNGFDMDRYLYPHGYHWKLNRFNISMETRTADINKHYVDQVVVKDSNIIQLDRYTSGQSSLISQKKIIRSQIPNVHFLLRKNIFGNNMWISNLGSFSPSYVDNISHFIIKSESTNAPLNEINHSYKIDSLNNIIEENLTDKSGAFLYKKMYYFSN